MLMVIQLTLEGQHSLCKAALCVPDVLGDFDYKGPLKVVYIPVQCKEWISKCYPTL